MENDSLKSIHYLYKSHCLRSGIEVILTVLVFVGLGTALCLLKFNTYAVIPLSLMMGLAYVRIFLLMHDCVHDALFVSKKWNRIVGSLLGLTILTPFQYWRLQHIKHHRYNANLDHRGIGDISVLTVEEFRRAGSWKKFLYILYRNPLIMFFLGGPFEFLVKMRFVKKYRHFSKQERKKSWRSVNRTTIFGILIYGALTLALGWNFLIFAFLIPIIVATAIGVFLFYIQHNFENSFFEKQSNWNHLDAALRGSSYIKLPRFFSWMICNINYHHVHHLSPCIPFYQLNKCHAEHAALKNVDAYNIPRAFSFIRLKLYDESRRCMIGWKAYKRLYRNRTLSV